MSKQLCPHSRRADCIMTFMTSNPTHVLMTVLKPKLNCNNSKKVKYFKKLNTGLTVQSLVYSSKFE